MPQIPLGDFAINPNVTSGVNLADILNRFESAMISQQSGATPPAVFATGTFWLDNTNPSLNILKIYSGTIWTNLFQWDPSTGIPAAGGVPVVSVNTRTGAIRVRELYDLTEATLIAQSSANGLDLVINQNADPATNLLGTMGRVAYDTTKNLFVGRTNVGWSPLGGGSYIEYANQVLADLASISSNNIAGFQYRPISSASDIAINAVPFVVTVPIFNGGQIMTVRNTGTFNITFNDSRGTASGLYLTDAIVLEPNQVISFIYDSASNLWYAVGGSGSGGGAWITYPLEIIAAGGTITSLDNKFFQYRRISSGAAIDLSLTPFGTVAWKDGVQINVFNNGANPITFKNGTATQFGLDFRGLDFILPAGQVASFQYDLTIERWLVIGTSAKSGIYTATQTVVAGDKVNLLSLPMQSIKLSAGGPVILNAIPFNIPLDLPDGAEIKLIGTSNTNTIEVDYEATNAILFGNAILLQNYILSLIYDKTNNYLIQTGKNY